MYNIRVRFIRGEEVKFISHLDLMKVFERALRRTGLPISYSQGFNPHPQMVFGLPLSVGVTSEAEYADFELSQEVNPAEYIEKLNTGLPPGIRIMEAAVRKTKENIMATIAGAGYEITAFLKESPELADMSERVSHFMNNNNIIVRKEGKGGVKDIDIKPMILKLDVAPVMQIPPGYEEFGSAFRFTALLRAGSVANLRPELLIRALSGDTGFDLGVCRVHRSRLFVEKDGKFSDPMDEVV